MILWFDEVGIEDTPLVGGKNASLGEMLKHLKKIPIPPGFAITTNAYRYTLESSGAFQIIQTLLQGLDVENSKQLAKTGHEIRQVIERCPIPLDLEEQILKAYRSLPKGSVAVRSSATAEDLPTASFAGQQASFLNVRGEKELIQTCRKCFASLFTDRAIAYRYNQKIDHLKTYLSIGVQKMIRSDLASAGVMFTLDTETGFSNVVIINASFGLGESIVQGSVNPDEFILFKPNLKSQKHDSIIDRTLGDKAIKIVYSNKGTKKVQTSKRERSQYCLSEKDALQLGQWGLAIEEYYKMPMDIEWAKDGKSKKLYILQARPETVHRKAHGIVEEYRLLGKGKLLLEGKSVGAKIANGKARVIRSVKEISHFKEGEILVTEMTDPDWVPIMRKAAAIVTNRGGRTSHAAIVSRELGLPCVVGTNHATATLKTGQPITVSCAGSGDRGLIYNGLLKFSVEKIDVKHIPKTKTKIMVNIGYPGEAFETSFLPNDGVGLARQEFIVGESIQIHPMALIDPKRVKDPKIRKKINQLTHGYKSKKDFFIDKLACGIAKIAAAFHPKDVILRFSDFKTNEYMNLIGGIYFEPKEENPMIGYRGASRYYSKEYEKAFALECLAIQKVRKGFGLKNLKVMVPVCRTVEEGKKVLKVLKKYGLERGKDNLEIYCMCEIPSNVILADEFSKIFDGFSIGSNDLTQMTLGVDRDNELVSELFDERNEAVKRMIARVIQVARKKKRKIGICGDAPSTYPEFAKFLVDCGIDSISLSSDAVMKTRLIIAKHEKS